MTAVLLLFSLSGGRVGPTGLVELSIIDELFVYSIDDICVWEVSNDVDPIGSISDDDPITIDVVSDEITTIPEDGGIEDISVKLIAVLIVFSIVSVIDKNESDSLL